ncbi:MAG: hypothetical protein RL020_332, partial [Pseudomonadota bacterium]
VVFRDSRYTALTLFESIERDAKHDA